MPSQRAGSTRATQPATSAKRIDFGMVETPVVQAGNQGSPRVRREVAGRVADDYKVVCVRLRAAEYDQFTRDAGAMGLTSSMALRIAARRIGGFLEVNRELRQDLEDVLQEIGTLSRAVRDLHGACMAGGVVKLEQLDHQRDTFGGAFAQLDGMLRSILNVSQRRADGRLLLVDAATK